MNLIRYYNQNRKQIWRILIIILSAILLLQFVNYLYKVRREKESTSNQLENQTINTSNASKVTTNESTVTGKKVENKQLQTAVDTIDQFISYCNNQDLEKAYDLLTEECKKEMYPNREAFKKSYYDNIFGGKKKTCTIENWVDNIYKVKIKEDILTTGKNEKAAKQEYMCVKKEDDEYKLNINGYLGLKEVKKKTQKDNIILEVLNRNTYMEYEEYTIKLTNQAEGEVLLDSLTNVKGMYLQDKNENKYFAYSHELSQDDVKVEEGETKTIKVKYYSAFVSTKTIEKMVFSDIIYKNGQLSERIELKVDI